MAIEKIKTLGPFWSYQLCQFSLFTAKMDQMGADYSIETYAPQFNGNIVMNKIFLGSVLSSFTFVFSLSLVVDQHPLAGLPQEVLDKALIFCTRRPMLWPRQYLVSKISSTNRC